MRSIAVLCCPIGKTSGNLFAALVLSVTACCVSSAGEAATVRPVSAGMTANEAVAAVAALPEVKAWGKYIIDSTNGRVHGALMVSPEQPETREGKQYWSVGYYEDQSTHMHRWQTFLVRLHGREILVDDPISGDYVSLREWRDTQKPMERVRPDADGPGDLLRRLYAYHRPWLKRDATAGEARAQFFEEPLARLFRRAEQCSARKHEMGELDFDPILSGQDYGGNGISNPIIRPVPSKSGTSYEVTFRLYPESPDSQTTVTYALVRPPQGWRIHDISWGKRNRTLRQLLSQTCD